MEDLGQLPPLQDQHLVFLLPPIQAPAVREHKSECICFRVNSRASALHNNVLRSTGTILLFFSVILCLFPQDSLVLPRTKALDLVLASAQELELVWVVGWELGWALEASVPSSSRPVSMAFS